MSASGKFYRFHTSGRDWYDAQADCQSRNGYLATFYTREVGRASCWWLLCAACAVATCATIQAAGAELLVREFIFAEF
jgi:hypothetical protein